MVDAETLRQQARAELARRLLLESKVTHSIDSLRATLGDKQRAFMQSRAPRRTMGGARQSGKSHTLATSLIDVSSASKCKSMYVAPTSKAARNAVWNKFYELNEAFSLGIEMREGAFEARFPNGSVVGFEGAHDTARVKRLRGATLTGMLCVDEAAFFPDTLLKELLGPTTSAMFMASPRGQNIIVASSPGLQKRGHFYELCHKHVNAWEPHRLTVYDNPVITDHERALREIREANAWTEQTPAYIREALGLWIDDATHNVYELTELNLVDHFPDGPWTTIMVVDFGKNDQSAISVAGWRPYDPALYVLHCEGESDLDIEDVCQRVQPLREKWAPIAVYGDPGGGGAQHMDYMRNRHQIPIRPVAKGKNYKAPAIRDLNADMRRGLYKVLRTSPMVEQMQALQWDPNHVGEQEHPSMPNDLCDVAGVYSWVNSRAFRAEQAPVPEPNYGTEDYLKQYAADGLKRAMAAANKHHDDIEEAKEDLSYLTGGDD